MGRRRAGPEAGGEDRSDLDESVNVDSEVGKVEPGRGPFRPGSGDLRRKLPRDRGPGQVFLILKDMRRVYQKGKETDQTECQRLLRRMLENEPEWFLTKMIDLEKAWMTYKLKIGKVTGGRVPHSLKGSLTPARGKALDRSEALIDSLLNKAGGVNGAESGDELQAGAADS